MDDMLKVDLADHHVSRRAFLLDQLGLLDEVEALGGLGRHQDARLGNRHVNYPGIV
jgi:hypothetical protein